MTAKELGDELGQPALAIGRIRKRLCGKSGGDIPDNEAEAIREYYDLLESSETKEELAEAIKPQFVFGVVTYAKESSRRVEVRIKPNLERAIALMPIGVKPDRILLKTIKLEVIEYEGQKHYRCASLAGRVWANGPEPTRKQSRSF